MTGNISLVVAFSAGILSFLSPCVLPLVPVYLASLYGPEVYDDRVRTVRFPLFLHSLSFVVGFAVIFTLLGAIAGLTGYAINLSSTLLNTIAGSLLVALGLFMLAALKVPWLNYERRLTPSAGTTGGYLRSFFVGAVFCLGWTPCVAPVLGGILALASIKATAWQGASLLAIYSLGMGLPFLIIGAAFDSVRPLLKRLSRYSRWIYIISGGLLIIVGILVLTNKLGWISSLTA